MTELKSRGKISPFDTMYEDIGNVFVMLNKAIELHGDVWLQPPHWDREPTKLMAEEEERLEQKMRDARQEINRLAGEIYKSLTGKECFFLPDLEWYTIEAIHGDKARYRAGSPLVGCYEVWLNQQSEFNSSYHQQECSVQYVGKDVSLAEAKKDAISTFAKILLNNLDNP